MLTPCNMKEIFMDIYVNIKMLVLDTNGERTALHSGQASCRHAAASKLNIIGTITWYDNDMVMT